MSGKISKAQRFVYETLLTERIEEDGGAPDDSPPDVQSAYAQSEYQHHWIRHDPHGIESCRVLLGAESSWDSKRSMYVIAVWFDDGIEVPFEDLIKRAVEVWQVNVKRMLKRVELTARHQGEMLELDILSISDTIQKDDFELPSYKFLGQTIGPVD